MPSFPEPNPPLEYSLTKEKKAITDWFTNRNVPNKKSNKLLIGSWNIANLGEQKRSLKDLRLLAHLLSRFDLIAVQEIKDDFQQFKQVVKYMQGTYDWIINDTGGNNERLGFIYDTSKVKPGKQFAEIAFTKRTYIKEDIYVINSKKNTKYIDIFRDMEFVPFDRNPFLGTFEAGSLNFTLVNVHLYFGGFKSGSTVKERQKYARRVLEILMLSKWAKKRAKGKNTYDPDIILIGDMNVPMMHPDEPAYKALLKSELQPKNYYTKTGGSNISGRKTYDQMALTEGDLQNKLVNYDVFDFDNAVFKDKWEELVTEFGDKKAISQFNKYVKFYISDHRPLWLQFNI